MAFALIKVIGKVCQSLLMYAPFCFLVNSASAMSTGIDSNDGDLPESLVVDSLLDSELQDSSTMTWIETRRRALSGDVVALGAYIDGLMGNVDSIADHNQSYVRLYLGLKESKYENTEVLHRVRFSLDLPITKQRFRFILESESEEVDESVQLDQEPVGVLLEDGEVDDGVNATFRYIFEAEHWDRLSFDWGAKARLEPDLFTRARAKRSWNLSERWSLTFAPELFWFDSRGAGVRTFFDFDRFLKKSYLFRFRSSITWLERYSTISYTPKILFYHDISQRRAVEYSIGFTAEDQDNHTCISEYFSQIRYRRDLYKGWLFYQMSLGATFPREFDYNTNPFIGLRLEILFSEDIDKVLRTRLH